MRHDDLDRILSGEPEIVPSSGFSASVMDAVRREAATPAPIPFPWRRALPGMVVFAAALAILGVEVVAQPGGAVAPTPHLLAALVDTAEATGAGWIALALLVWFASMMLSSHLAGRRAS